MAAHISQSKCLWGVKKKDPEFAALTCVDNVE